MLAIAKRQGEGRTRVVPPVNGQAVGESLRAHVREGRRLLTNESQTCERTGQEWFQEHQRVVNIAKEYSRHGIDVNTAESFFALVKRDMYGVVRSVSKKHIHLYADECTFRFSHRRVDHRERTGRAIRGAEGKCLRHSESTI